MKFSKLLTPKGRRAIGKLSLDLLKTTGKVAVAGTVGLAGALASAATSTNSSPKETNVWTPWYEVEDGFHTFGPDGPGWYQGGCKLDDD